MFGMFILALLSYMKK
ncbi:hypothetical protein M3625_15930 [Paenibacillus sp. MER 78]|nr:hypothetical protein [Paenibacillus sp. MER 78]